VLDSRSASFNDSISFSRSSSSTLILALQFNYLCF
jgi:hypothetical protein